MKAKQKRFIKTVLSVAMLASIYSFADAQNNDAGVVTTQTTGLSTTVVVPPAYDSTMQQAGCDQTVWNQMVTDYTKKAQVNIANGNAIFSEQIKQAPTASAVGSCFDSAAQTINSATRVYNTISSFFSGTPDSSQLLGYAQKLAIGAACSQINSYVATSSLGTSINSGVGTVNSGVGTVLGTGSSVSGINTGTSVGQVLNNTGANSTTNTSAISSTNGSTLGNIVTSINPFK